MKQAAQVFGPEELLLRAVPSPMRLGAERKPSRRTGAPST
jgi:hypothetical protein